MSIINNHRGHADECSPRPLAFLPVADLRPRQLLLFPAPWAWAMLLLLVPVVMAGFAFSSMRYVADGLADSLTTLAVMMLLAGVAIWRGWPRLAALLQAVVFLGIVGLLARPLNYLLMELNFPYIDAALNATHAWIGFDWPGHVLWINDHPTVAKVFTFAYESYKWLLPATVLGLALLGKLARLREFLLLLALCGLATTVIGTLLPAQGPFGYLGFSPAGLEHIPLTGTDFLSDMDAVRAGALEEFRTSEALGLITFPSYHTIMALFFAWAWRGTWLQWPVWILSALTIAATPALGSHYLPDLLGGALLFWAVVKLLDRVGASDTAARRHLWRLLPWRAVPRPAAPAAAE